MSHKGTPTLIKREESQKDRQQEIKEVLENFNCDVHKQFKMNALKVRPDKSISLLCIKCIIDGDGDCGKGGENDQLITISELVQNCCSSLINQKNNVKKSRDTLHNRFSGILTKGYPDTYEKILKDQFKRLDKQITDLKNALDTLRDKYEIYYEREIEKTREQGVEIKTVIEKIIEDHPEAMKEQLTSVNDLYEQVICLQSHEDLQNFLQELYLKSNKIIEDVTDSDECKKLIEEVEELKKKTEMASLAEVKLPNFDGIMHDLDDLLQEDSLSFRKSIGLSTRGRRMEIENKIAFEGLGHDYSMQLEVPYMESEPSFSPRSRDAPTTVKKSRVSRNVESTEKTAKKKREKPTDVLNSQSLRNLKKEIEKEGKDPKGAKAKLIDWINRRLTGYLIFQNTIKEASGMKDQGMSETGIHLNHLTGHKWKALSDREKKDFKDLANHYRGIFKRDVEESDSIERETDLLDVFDEKIKKIKMM